MAIATGGFYRISGCVISDNVTNFHLLACLAAKWKLRLLSPFFDASKDVDDLFLDNIIVSVI